MTQTLPKTRGVHMWGPTGLYDGGDIPVGFQGVPHLPATWAKAWAIQRGHAVQ